MLIIGCGNRQRSDDMAGILVAEKLRELGIQTSICSGQAMDLIEAWTLADNVIVVDVVVTGAPVGTVRTWDARQPLTSGKAALASTHGLGVAEAIELARVLGRLPARLQVYGIEGQRFECGAENSLELASGIEEVVRRIIDLIATQGSELHAAATGVVKSAEKATAAPPGLLNFDEDLLSPEQPK